VGYQLGRALGFTLGLIEGITVVGKVVGLSEGCAVGRSDGFTLGNPVGFNEGLLLGFPVGLFVGISETGIAVGIPVGA
jgi:hypothetical protein